MHVEVPGSVCSNDWAFGGDPLEQVTELWRYAALAVPSIVLIALGLVAVDRRDVMAP